MEFHSSMSVVSSFFLFGEAVRLTALFQGQTAIIRSYQAVRNVNRHLFRLLF